MRKVIIILLLVVVIIGLEISSIFCEEAKLGSEEVIEKYLKYLETFNIDILKDIVKEPLDDEIIEHKRNLSRYWQKIHKREISIIGKKVISDDYIIYLLKIKQEDLGPMKVNGKIVEGWEESFYPEFVNLIKLADKWLIDNTEEREREEMEKKYGWRKAKGKLKTKKIKRLKKMSEEELERERDIRIAIANLSEEVKNEPWFGDIRSLVSGGRVKDRDFKKDIDNLKLIKKEKLREYFIEIKKKGKIPENRLKEYYIERKEDEEE